MRVHNSRDKENAMSNVPTLPAIPMPNSVPPVDRPTKKVTGVHWYPSEAEAAEVAITREKGARFVFGVTQDGVTRWCVASHYHFVAHDECKRLGIAIVQSGKEPRKQRVDGLVGVMAAVNALPEAERSKVLEQLRLLAGK
jgi:hypothetical protein